MKRIDRVFVGWTGTLIRAGWVLAAAGCWVHSFQGHAAQPALSTVNYTTNAEDKAACERRLNIIFGAIQQYRKQHAGMLPGKLSDLRPDILDDELDLTCPFVQNRGGLRGWKKKFKDLS